MRWRPAIEWQAIREHRRVLPGQSKYSNAAGAKCRRCELHPQARRLVEHDIVMPLGAMSVFSSTSISSTTSTRSGVFSTSRSRRVAETFTASMVGIMPSIATSTVTSMVLSAITVT